MAAAPAGKRLAGRPAGHAQTFWEEGRSAVANEHRSFGLLAGDGDPGLCGPEAVGEARPVRTSLLSTS